MNRIAPLLETPAVALMEFDHPPDADHCDPEQEVASSDSINFVEDGSFDVHVDDEHWRLAPGTLFVTRRGMTFSCRHTDEAPSDRCVTVSYSGGAVEDLMRIEIGRQSVAADEGRRIGGKGRHRQGAGGKGADRETPDLAAAKLRSVHCAAPARRAR